jgi:hypothetical protein
MRTGGNKHHGYLLPRQIGCQRGKQIVLTVCPRYSINTFSPSAKTQILKA